VARVHVAFRPPSLASTDIVSGLHSHQAPFRARQAVIPSASSFTWRPCSASCNPMFQHASRQHSQPAARHRGVQQQRQHRGQPKRRRSLAAS